MSDNLKVGHLNIDSPWANAGGVIKHVEDVEVIARSGVGWIEAGSYTLEPRKGNSPNGEIVYIYDTETGSTWNSLGMPNKGIDIVEKEIPLMQDIAKAHNKPLVINVAPVTDDPISESLELVSRAYEAGADAVLLNAGCPNVVSADGGRHEILSHNPKMLFKALDALHDLVSKYNKIFLRVSPLENEEQIDKICRSINMAGTVSVVFTPNTWPNSKPPEHLDQLEVPGGMGGLSGPVTARNSFLQTVRIAMRGKYDVVSCSGIMTGEELYKRIGHSLTPNVVAGAGTTFFYQSGDWRHDVDMLLNDYAFRI